MEFEYIRMFGDKMPPPVPTTDEEAEKFVRCLGDSMANDSLAGLYRIYRKRDQMSIADSIEKTLRLCLELQTGKSDGTKQ